MNIAFFGTSDRSIPILEALKNSQFDLTLCVTKDDVRVGRKQELRETAVKQWARDNGVHFVTADEVNPQTTERIATALKKHDIKVGVVADFSFIIPEEIINTPEYKLVNIHFSLLPHYRGASPVQFAILNQDKFTGISYQIVVKELDAGPLLHQTKYKLNGNETAEEVNEKLFKIAANEIEKVLENYVSQKIVPKKQGHSKATYTYSNSHPNRTTIFKEDAKIDWSKSAEEIDAAARAYYPWPIAWTTLGEFKKFRKDKNPNLKIKIYKTALKKSVRSKNNSPKKPTQATKLSIEKIQVEGKNIMTWEEFKNGYLEGDSETLAVLS